MTNRPAGGERSKRWERAPYDWYLEPPSAVEQIFAGLGDGFFANDLIWDPCCGRGGILDVAKRWGHPTVGSDIIDRHPCHRFIRGNVLTQIGAIPRYPSRETSVISNTPYSYEKDVAERIICHVLERFAPRRAAFILPIAFLAGQERWRGGQFAGKFRPSHTCIYRERHTMPPGHLIDEMPKPFEGGMQDYCCIIFSRPHRWRTEILWLPPGHHVPKERGVTSGTRSEQKAA